jgi:hypothetical protein
VPNCLTYGGWASNSAIAEGKAYRGGKHARYFMNGWPESRTIRLMADYECHPLWLSGPQAGDIAPDDPRLALSSTLAKRLSDWADEYDGTLCADDPKSSGFSSREGELTFYRVGEELAVQLAKELGNSWTVTYHDGRTEP